MPIPETYPHAEERRLFYVALTRAKHRVFLLENANNPSCFVRELREATELEQTIEVRELELRNSDGSVAELRLCPLCSVGKLRLKSGNFGQFYGCSYWPECKYTENAAQN